MSNLEENDGTTDVLGDGRGRSDWCGWFHRGVKPCSRVPGRRTRVRDNPGHADGSPDHRDGWMGTTTRVRAIPPRVRNRTRPVGARSPPVTSDARIAMGSKKGDEGGINSAGARMRVIDRSSAPDRERRGADKGGESDRACGSGRLEFGSLPARPCVGTPPAGTRKRVATAEITVRTARRHGRSEPEDPGAGVRPLASRAQGNWTKQRRSRPVPPEGTTSSSRPLAREPAGCSAHGLPRFIPEKRTPFAWSVKPGNTKPPRAMWVAGAVQSRGIQSPRVATKSLLPPAGAPSRDYSPLRSIAITRMPCLSPNALTASSLAGRVMWLFGARQMPIRGLGVSLFLFTVPSTASPLRISGEALSIRMP